MILSGRRNRKFKREWVDGKTKSLIIVDFHPTLPPQTHLAFTLVNVTRSTILIHSRICNMQAAQERVQITSAVLVHPNQKVLLLSGHCLCFLCRRF